MKDYLEYKETVDNILGNYLPDICEENKALIEAMKYSLMAGGKRLRPALLLAACDYACGSILEAYPYSCALEYIHTYSLIHDDLPAMDNDELRRGIPTNHIVHGEAMAILAGDGLLNTAFEIMANDITYRLGNGEDVSKYVYAMKSIAESCGANGMIGGQSADILGEKINDDEITESYLSYIHLNKTSKLIIAAIKAGLYLGNAAPEMIKDFEIYGKNLGLAFQISDDILDVTGSPNLLGKSIGKDSAEKKITYVSMYGLDKAKEELKLATDNAIEAISGYDNTDFFVNLVRRLEKRDS